jgi:hypothetical protein
MLRFLFRPSILIALSAAVVVGAVVVVFRGPPTQGRPTPLRVNDGEREIVWLYPATNATSWERFVAAVRRTAQRLRRDRPSVQADDDSAFPQQTTAVPEVSLSFGEPGPRFLFRWYKLTSDWKTGDWIEALLNRQPPPLAIIGGSSSESARELATFLQRFAEKLPAEQRPLLLLTAATADRVGPHSQNDASQTAAEESAGQPLMRLYPGRTFRFCFTNKQMATAVSNFIWSRDDLRPDRDPVYMARWSDDSYSRDLIDGFRGALRQMMAQDIANQCLCLLPAASVAPLRVAMRREFDDTWEWTTQAIFGVWPPGRSGGIFPIQRLQISPDYAESASTFALTIPPKPYRIGSSVGSFDTPNAYEAKAAAEMLDAIQSQKRIRPLVIVTGQEEPSRRFLRGLVRGIPSLSKGVQIVVATGDAISFNTVYRDRHVSWNIQDLPFPLVFFCHHNPIDADAGFRAGAIEDGPSREGERDITAETGTEEVLLFSDIVEALVQAGAPAEETPCANATELAERLANTRREDDRIALGDGGVPLFDDEGQRRSGTGEHVVYLQPMWNEDFKDRLLPRATIEVWAWRRRDWSQGERGQYWERRCEPLTVWYSDSP